MKAVKPPPGDIPFHPIADELPLMPAYELGRLEESIRERKLRHPIVLYDGRVLDGRNRYLACKAAGIEPSFVEFKGTPEDAELYAQDANEERRHLADDWLRRRRDERLGRVAEARRNGQSVRSIADQEGVSKSQVGRDLKDASATPAAPDSASSNGQVSPPGTPDTNADQQTVTGKDGKTYRATKRKLCDRCQRVAPGAGVKGCAACADLNRKGGKKKGDAAEKPKPPRAGECIEDHFGNDVPARRLDAWGDTWIQETFDALAKFSEDFRAKRFADGLGKRGKHYPFLDVKDFRDGVGFVIDYLDKLIEHLKDNRPAGVCPSCAGNGCGDCRSSGLVPRKVYLQLRAKEDEA